ncbi:MAG: WD40 repeat protein, partial [Verrucomicrobiales bacterium]
SANPFPGLRSFRQDEDYLFFGREEQTIELLQRLANNRFVSVVGTSGSGKSSLVRCGLLSELLGGKMLQAGASWEVAVTHPGGNPLALLTDALLEADLYDAEEDHARENLLATLSRTHFGLVEAIRLSDVGEDTNFLLVVDQFEEIFRFREAGKTQQEAAAEFVSLLLAAANQDTIPIYVVLTMRSDFIGECSQFEGLAEMVNRGEFLIPRLNREQYKRVIEGPVKVAGGKIAPRLMQRLLNDLGQQADQLPCLQHALMRTWDVWAGHGETEALDLDDYQRVGKMAEALSLHADEVYQALASDRERQLCEAAFQALTVKESENRGIRRPQRLGALCEILKVASNELVPVIDAYRQQGVTFLMPPSDVDLDEETVIDISHESLMRVWARLRHWVDDEAQAAGIYRRLAESATLYGEGEAALFRDPELGIALAWRENKRPNEAWAVRYRPGFTESMTFLEASRETAEAEEQEREAARQRELKQARELAEAQRLRAEEKARSAHRMRWLMRVAMGVAVVAVIASIYAWQNAQLFKVEKANAKKEETKAVKAGVTLREELYVADINRASQAYDEGGMELLDNLLTRQIPKEGNPDLRGPEWYLWRHASRRSLAAMNAMTFKAIVAAPDQQTVATASFPNAISVYDVDSRNVIKTFNVEIIRNGVDLTIAYSPKGGTLAAAGPQSSLRRWNTRTWEQINPDLAFPPSYTNGIQAGTSPAIVKIAYSRDGSVLAGGSSNGYLALWDTRTWQVIHVFDVFEEKREFKGINDLAFSPDSSRLAVAVGDSETDQGALVILDITRREVLLREQDKHSRMRSVAYSPDDRWLVSGSENGEVKLWDAAVPAAFPPEQLYKARGSIVDVAFSPTGTYLAASTAEGNAILVWEMPSQRLVSTLKGHNKPSHISFVGNESTLWSASEDWFIKVWDVRNSGLHQEAAPLKDAAGMSYLAGGRLAWRNPQLGDPDGEGVPIQLYDVAQGQELAPWQEGEKFTLHAASRNGRFLAAEGMDRQLRLWDSESGALLGTTPDPVNESPNSRALLTVAEDGSRVAWLEEEAHKFHLWSPGTGRPVQIWPATIVKNRHSSLVLSPDGTLLASSGGGIYNMYVWDTTADPPVVLTSRVGPPMLAMDFSPDSKLLACGLWTGEIKIREARTGEMRGAPLQGNTAAVTQLAFFPDGKTLVSAGLDQTIRLWDAKDVDRAERLATLPSLDGSAKRLVVEPQGQWLAAAVAGQAARIWRLDDAPDPRRAEMTWWEDGAPAFQREYLTDAPNFTDARKAARKSTEQAPDVGMAWLALAAIAVHDGDLETFRKVRRDVRTRFSDTPFLEPAAIGAILCTVLPAAPDELSAGLRLAERVAADGPGPAFAVQGYAPVALILGEYRRGHYEQALDQATEFLKTPGRNLGVADPWAKLTVAMSQHQLHQPAEAHRALTQARKWMAFEDHPLPLRWYIKMLEQALLREAEALIEGKAGALQ